MKQTLNIILLLTILVSLVACSTHSYDKDWIIGKTSEEIIEQYGAFDFFGNDPNEEGLYLDTRCGYKIKESKKGLLETSTDVYYMIYFDKDGIAYTIDEDWIRPGG